MTEVTVPEGFEPIFRTSPFLELIGPLYNKKVASTVKTGAAKHDADGLQPELVVGFRALDHHCNARELVHGGVLSSVADVALGYNAAFSGAEPVPMVTANLSIDYSGSAKLGDWVEVRTQVQKVGRTLAFANCFFVVDEKQIARASAVFGIVAR